MQNLRPGNNVRHLVLSLFVCMRTFCKLISLLAHNIQNTRNNPLTFLVLEEQWKDHWAKKIMSLKTSQLHGRTLCTKYKQHKGEQGVSRCLQAQHALSCSSKEVYELLIGQEGPDHPCTPIQSTSAKHDIHDDKVRRVCVERSPTICMLMHAES